MEKKTSVSVSYSEEELVELKISTGKDRNHEAVKEAVRLGLDFIRKAAAGGGDANSVNSVIVVGGGSCNAGAHADGEAAKKVFDELCMNQARCDTCRYSPENFKREHGGRPCMVTCFTRWLCDSPSADLRA